VTPLLDEPNVSAYDMRGVTFVFNEDGTLYNGADACRLIIDGKLNLRNKPKAEVVQELEKLKFDKIEDLLKNKQDKK
jgi:hypothetical protein